jgi:hypothetical protein
MNKLITIGLFVATIYLTACGVLMFREVECREFTITEEEYWHSGKIGDSITFYDQSNNKLTYRIERKEISHRPKYLSDTGCGCFDVSDLIITNDHDSIWFQNIVQYVENDDAEIFQNLYFAFNNKQSYFNETVITLLSSVEIKGSVFTNVKMFEFEYKDEFQIKSAYLVKGLGLVQFTMANGNIWTNENLTTYNENEFDSFSYRETQCE